MKRKFCSHGAKFGVYLLIFSFVLSTISPSVLYAGIDGVPPDIEKAALQAGKEAAAIAARAAEATPESVALAAAQAASKVALDAGLSEEQVKELTDLAAIKATGGTAIAGAIVSIVVLAVVVGGIWYAISTTDGSTTTVTHVFVPTH